MPSSGDAGSLSVTVFLVGAGPGDPGLLTVAGAEALRRADVVVYDFLANPRLLALAPPEAERLYVGKSAGAHTLTQDQINRLLVDKARELHARFASSTKSDAPASASDAECRMASPRRTIVRLKGGDPYVFGRGGEEGEFLRAHGVPFAVIPGITSGIAGPAYAGIPVTHRDFASTITLITGHEKDRGGATKDRDEVPPINFDALAKLKGTLVFYMGVKALPQIVSRLLAGGMEPATPAAVIRWATRPEQQTVVGTLDTLVEAVRQAGIAAPAITVVGRVVSLRETLNWFEQRPLFGQRILVTRTRQQASELAAGLASLGAQVMEAPTIELAAPEDWTPIDAALRRLDTYDWLLLTSANGVRAVWERLRRLGRDARAFPARVGAIGPATAAALEQIGIVPDLIPEKFVGEALAAALRQCVGDMRGRRFLLLRANIARPALREALQAAGAVVEDVAIYRTRRPAALPAEVLETLGQPGGVSWITFTSASTVHHFDELLPAALRPAVAAVKKLSIGPVTSAALRQVGWPPDVEAARHDIPGMLAALRQHLACR